MKSFRWDFVYALANLGFAAGLLIGWPSLIMETFVQSQWRLMGIVGILAILGFIYLSIVSFRRYMHDK